MSELEITALIIGGVFAALGLPGLVFPNMARMLVRRFPRSVVAAWLLAAIDLVWAAWILYHAVFLAEMPGVRKLVVILLPVSFFLIVFFMAELLAPRALGGLLLLLGEPVLRTIRWFDAPLKWILPVMVYIWVVVGIILVLSPYRFRKAGDVLTKNTSRTRISGAFITAWGLFIIYLGLVVY
jgi:hypothetical protein